MKRIDRILDLAKEKASKDDEAVYLRETERTNPIVTTSISESGYDVKTPGENIPEEKSSSDSSSSSSSTNSSDSTSVIEDSDACILGDSDDSVKDPNYVRPQYKPVRIISESDDSDLENMVEGGTPLTVESIPTSSNSQQSPTDLESTMKKKTRKRVANPKDWRQNKAKFLRSAGLEYKTKKNITKRARLIKPPCNEKCRLKCSEKITEEERNTIFKYYWELKDINRQRDMINKNMTAINRKYRYTTTQKGRNMNNAFYFTIDDRKIRVCKTFFMNTLDINNRNIQTVLKKRTLVDTIDEDKRGKHNNHRKLPDEIKAGVRQHINSIPRIESHYLRPQTSKEYIEGGKTIADLHNDYKTECEKNGMPFANYVMYAKIFNTEFNLSFFVPKKDRCELCVAYENSEAEEKDSLKVKYLKHLDEKELSRKEKQLDKESDNIVAVYDLQAVQPVPKGTVSVFYYKSKLNCFNFTITDIKNKKTECYFWHEGIGNRGPDEIGTCVYKYIEKTIALYNNRKINIIFYSDNASGQNKNRFIIAMYLYCILKFDNLNSIMHKFLITGHTQNEGDSVHSVIEKSIKRHLKSGPIYEPSQYIQIIKGAKKTGDPYNVNELTYSDFVSIKKLANDLKLAKVIKISDIKVMKFLSESPDILYYKTSFGDMIFSTLKLFKTTPTLPSLKNAYLGPIALSKNKKSDLKSLLKSNHIPKYYEGFYKSVFQDDD